MAVIEKLCASPVLTDNPEYLKTQQVLQKTHHAVAAAC
jgi:hypothetical protein